jgi:hypothetical protein
MCGKEGRREDWISFRLVALEDGGVDLSRGEGERMSFGVRLVFQIWSWESAASSRMQVGMRMGSGHMVSMVDGLLYHVTEHSKHSNAPVRERWWWWLKVYELKGGSG